MAAVGGRGSRGKSGGRPRDAGAGRKLSAGAKGATLTLTPAVAGTRIRVTMTLTRAGHAPVRVTRQSARVRR